MTRPRHAWLFSLGTAAALVLLAVLAQGQDANWDLRNYHLYSPLAWLDGRLQQDIAAAQMQTWHNPTLDLPLALMIRGGAGGALVSAWLALPAVIALFFALRLLDALWPERRSRLRTLCAGAVAISGAAAWPGTGASFNDAAVAACVIAALWWAVTSHGRRSPWAIWLPVGLLAGAAAGLKLTAAIYCIGFIAAAMTGGPRRESFSRLAALAVGGIVAVLVTWGPWAWQVWTLHANPVFPYFNQWFLSPDALPHAHKDERFLPATWLDALMVPVHLLKHSRRFSEVALTDPRLLLGLIASIAWIVRQFKQRRHAVSAATSSSLATSVVAFVVVSYALWLGLYGIYRYLYALEMLFSIAIVGVLSQYVIGRWHKTALIVGSFIVVAATNPPEWGRQPFRSPMIRLRVPELPAGSLVLISSYEPLGHAVAYLPRSVPVLAVQNNFMNPEHCTRLQAIVESRVAAQQGPLFLLRQVKDDAAVGARISLYGLSVSGDCLPVESSLVPLQLCPLRRAPFTPICSAPRADR